MERKDSHLREASRTPTLAEFQNRHRRETIIVCGCGQSLRGFHPPKGLVTIGVNDVGRQFTPDYLLVVNPPAQFQGDRFHYVKTSAARFIFTQLELGLHHKRVVRFRLGQRNGTNTDDPDVLPYTANSPYVAVCLAALMGAKRIGLLGVDFTVGHFFGGENPHPLSSQLSCIDAEYEALHLALDRRGVELVNLSPISRLKALPRVTIEKFLEHPAVLASAVGRSMLTPALKRRVFFVNYRFVTCGDVFATGLAHAAEALGICHDAAWWDDSQLPSKVRTFAPELLFVVHGRRFASRWASLLRECKSAVWLVDEPYEVDDTSRWSSMFGTVFINDPTTLARHKNAHCLPVCFDSLVHRDPRAGREYRVGFIGGYNPVRERFLVRLAKEGLLSYIIGGPWKAVALRRLVLTERSSPAETARLYQHTQIVINVFRSVHHFNRDGLAATALNPRIFEALACGALVVTEPRPSLAAFFPELPTFCHEDALVATVRELLDDPERAATLLKASRERLVGQDYAPRLANALQVALGEPVADGRGRFPAPVAGSFEQPPAGWVALGVGVTTDADAGVTLTADGLGETGLVSVEPFNAVRLSFEARLDAQCEFIAKLHHGVPGDRAADSYHLLATPEHCYVARHHVVLTPITLARDIWQRVEMAWSDGALTVRIDGREACRCFDAALAKGYCFVGVASGSAALRGLRLESLTPEDSRPVFAGWSVHGKGTLNRQGDDVVLSADSGYAVSLISEVSPNDVELTFAVRLSAGAHFIAKLHHQAADDPNANSYHLVSTPACSYLARHDCVFAEVRLERRAWQQVSLRWMDQCLELFVNPRRCVQVVDNLMQSGHCVVGIAAGRAELRGLAVRDVSASKARRAAAIVAPSPQPGRDPLLFTMTPRRNLIYHVWPVRGEMWRWNIEQLRSRIDLFNGRRIISIVHDERSEGPDEVRKVFAGHGCEFTVARNGPSGEGLTFPSMLARVRSLDPDEVTFYAHAKGVRHEPSVPGPVRRWSEILYRSTLDHWPLVRAQLERSAMTGSFKMLGRFRAHHYTGDWHYSGTFFWLRHAYVFARDVGSMQSFYGCVEAWPGVHFKREETGCLFMDELRQLPYHESFWTGIGNAAFARWEASLPAAVPPADLLNPPPFEGYSAPRLEQRPEEFAWLLDELASTAPRRMLTIGAMHGGAEWHIARRFRALGRKIEITVVDVEARPELLATLDDARHRFGQLIELVVGDSTASITRERLRPQYDAVFIDGDHSYRAARSDVEFALGRSARLIALHDIADSDWHAQARCSVSRVWAELRARHSTAERVVGRWGGIGIVRL